MNVAAALVAPAANPLGIGVGAKGGGQRTIGGSESFLRDLGRELARPAKPEGLQRAASSSKGADAEADIGPSGARRRADDSAPPKPAEEQAVDDRTASADAPEDAPSATETPALEGDGTAANQADSPGGPDGTGSVYAAGAEVGTAADAAEAQAPGAPVDIDAASQARQEQASAARPLPADRPLTIRELNEALAMVDPSAWPKGMLRDLGVDRLGDRTPARREPGPEGREARRDSGAQETDPVAAASPQDEQPWSLSERDAEPAIAHGGRQAFGSRGSAAREDPASTDQSTGRESGHEGRKITGVGDGPAFDRSRGWRDQATVDALSARVGLDRVRRGADAEEKPVATPAAGLGRLERVSGATGGPAAAKRGEQAADRPGASEMPFAAQVGRGVRAALEQGGEITLHLRPEALGSMRVSVDARETGVTVQFEVREPDTARLLDRALDDLSNALRERGLNLEKVSVEVRPATAEHASPQAGDTPPHASNSQGGLEHEHQHRDSGGGAHAGGRHQGPRGEGAPEQAANPVARTSAASEGPEEMTLAWRVDTVV